MRISFKNPPSCYWSNKTKMSYIQRRLIVYSILYYKDGVSLVSDNDFDELSKQLIEMSKENPEEYKKTRYYYCMHDFDGSTGFDLFSKLNVEDKQYLNLISQNLIKQRGLK